MIIRGLRLIDTRTGEYKTLIKELGGVVYFSDDTKCTIEEYEKYFEVVKATDAN